MWIVKKFNEKETGYKEAAVFIKNKDIKSIFVYTDKNNTVVEVTQKDETEQFKFVRSNLGIDELAARVQLFKSNNLPISDNVFLLSREEVNEIVADFMGVEVDSLEEDFDDEDFEDEDFYSERFNESRDLDPTKLFNKGK